MGEQVDRQIGGQKDSQTDRR